MKDRFPAPGIVVTWLICAVIVLAFWSFIGWLAYLLVMRFTHGGTS